MKKTIIWTLLFVLLATAVSGAITDDLKIYYQTDNSTIVINTIVDFEGFKNSTNTGMAVNQSGKILDGVSGADGADYMGTNSNLIGSDFGSWTISLWINPNQLYSGADGDAKYIWSYSTDGTHRLEFAKFDSAVWGVNYAFCLYFINANNNWGDGTFCSNTDAWAANQWTHIVTTYDNTINLFKIYVNGSLDLSVACTTNDCSMDAIADEQLYFNTYSAGLGTAVSGFNMEFDEIGIWSKAISLIEVQKLWNSGAGLPRNEFNATPQPQFVIEGNEFTSPIRENTSQLYSVNVSYNGSMYSNLTAEIIYNGTITQALNFTITANYTKFNITLPIGFIYENATTFNYFWNISYYNISGSHWLPEITANYPQTILWNLSRNLRVNISAYSRTTAARINNFSINFSGYNRSTTDGQIFAHVGATGNYTITMDSPDFELQTGDVEFIAGEFKNHTFKVYTTNSVNITFRDEVTDNLVYNVTFELISDIFAGNYTTNPNASKYLDLISPSSYILRYSKLPEYPQKIYIFTLVNRTYNEITAYLTNGSSNVSITIYDEINNLVEGAELEVLKYDITTNTYRLVEVATTNFEGQTVIHVFKNVEFYKFRIRYNGELRPILPNELTTTLPTYIYGDALTFQIRTTGAVAQTFYDVAGITFDWAYNNVTGNIRFEYSEATGTMTQACVDVTATFAGITTAYANSCNSGASGTILIPIAEVNKTTYRATATGTFAGEDSLIDIFSHEFLEGDVMGKLGLFLTILLTLAFAMAFLFSPVVALIITPIPLIISSVAGFVAIPVSAAIGVEVIFIIIAFLISDKN